MFLRHDDARENVAKSILSTVLKQSKSARKAGQKHESITGGSNGNSPSSEKDGNVNGNNSIDSNSNENESIDNKEEKDKETEEKDKEEKEKEKEKSKDQVPTTTIEDDLRVVVLDVANHVCLVKSTEQSVIRFLNCKVIDQDFHEWMSKWIDSLFDNHFDRFIVAGSTLLAK
ncbi:hypothetical protein RFI_33489, partial [Reticulomyxa filosa]